MAPLEIALLAVGVALAALLLVALRMKYTRDLAEFERGAGWHRMWTERIMDTTDERDGREPGPP